MVKLLRLTSNKDDDFDGAQDGLVFNVNMDDDLIVSPNAQIALKNLTFETDFAAFTTDVNNGLLTVKYETARTPNTYSLTPATYTKTTYADFFRDFNITSNKLLNTAKYADTGTDAVNQFCGQYKIDGAKQFKDIEFRLSPAMNPVINRNFVVSDNPTGGDPSTNWFIISDFFLQSTLLDSSYLFEIDYDKTLPGADLKAPDMCIMNGSAITSTRKHTLTPSNPGIQWSKGNAIFSVRVDTVRDNGSGKEQNGFEIGLATNIPFGQASSGGEILDTDVKFAVRVYKNTDDVAHIIPNADFTNNPVYVDNTGITPTNPAPTSRLKSDTIIISCRQPQNNTGNKQVIGQYFKENSAPDTLFTYDIPAGSEEAVLFPYIAMFDNNAAGGAKAHSPVVTLDPFVMDDYREDAYLKNVKPGMANTFGAENVFEILPNTLMFDYDAISAQQLPELDDEWYAAKSLGQTSFFQTHNGVWEFMGFDYGQLTSVNDDESKIPFIINTTPFPYGYQLIPENTFLLTQSDNYVVVLDSQKLISYECSKPQRDTQTRSVDVVGKRANILATIPVNNNDGIVEFQANEVLYIDFDNKGETAIRNLRLRVLDKSLQPVLVEGMSVMTLLIKDE